MNGSLPPSSRFTRAIRRAARSAIRVPVATLPVNAMPSTRSSSTSRSPTSPPPASSATRPAGQVVDARRERERGQRRELGRLAQRGVAGRQHRRELPGEQQQRVVPRHDAGDDAERLLEHERELGRLDGRDHAPLGGARQLGVEVERARGPADLVAVLDQRLAALAGHQLGQLVGALAQLRGDLVQRLGALGGRRARPLALRARRGAHGGVELLAVGRADLGQRAPRAPGPRPRARARCRRPARRRSAVASPWR